MNTLQYTIIKDLEQYYQYANRHEALAFSGDTSQSVQDEMELLEVLIDKWDDEHSILRGHKKMNPIELIQYLMAEHKMQAKDLAEVLGVSKGLVSDMLHYKKGLSKEVIRKLAAHFRLQQEALNQPYDLKSDSRAASEVKNKVPVAVSAVRQEGARRSAHR